MATPLQNIETFIPDLRDVPLDQLAKYGTSPLAHSITLYRERLKKNGMPLNNFNARIRKLG